jgi:hypothetical protein
MKTFHAILFGGIALMLAGCDSPARPINPACVIELYDGQNFTGAALQLQGPGSFPELEGLNGRDWDNEISSVRTGPACWAILYQDEGFSDRRMVIPPNSMLPNLGSMGGQAESIRLFDHPP